MHSYAHMLLMCILICILIIYASCMPSYMLHISILFASFMLLTSVLYASYMLLCASYEHAFLDVVYDPFFCGIID